MEVELIDLISPPASPMPSRSAGEDKENDDLIDLVSPSPTCAKSPSAAAASAAASSAAASSAAASSAAASASDGQADAATGPSAKALGKRKALLPVEEEPEVREPDSDSEDEVVEARPQAPAIVQDVVMNDADDDELQCTGRAGSNALMDFPHARENCIAHPFESGKESRCCTNCYCYVCDDHASSKCPLWSQHCFATHTSAKWRSAREAWRQRPKANGAAFSCSSSTPAAAASGVGGQLQVPRPAKQAKKVRVKSLHADTMMKLLEQARSPPPHHPPATCAHSAPSQVYPVEASEPQGLLRTVQLRPYQKQSLAFMLDLEQTKKDADTIGVRIDGGRKVRGGWLCDEMGMGKTMVCVSLVLAHPRVSSKGDDERKKTTLIIVQNTLVQQWADEVKTHAPKLRTVMHYDKSRNYDALAGGRYDVVITTPHMKLNEPRTRFHRLIIDECHLLGCGEAGGYSSRRTHLKELRPNYTWLISGTPFKDFKTQLEFMGHLRDGEGRRVLKHGLDIPGSPTRTAENAKLLRQLMIRHSKAQRIHGEVALKLPELTCRTELLDFSADERLLYEAAGCRDGTAPCLRPWAEGAATSSQAVLRNTDYRMQVCAHLYGSLTGMKEAFSAERLAAWGRLMDEQVVSTVGFDGQPRRVRTVTPKFSELSKPKKLIEDMRAMQAADPNVRVIVFTKHDQTQKELVKLFSAKLSSFVVFEFNQQTAPVKRHKIIREFQGSPSSGFAAACIATFATAAVGLTLTAASRVYLFEPADRATEAQAAGRIHRLGQTKEVHVVRLAFRSSVEHALVEKNEAIKNGSITDGTAEGRQALRDLYKKHAAHVTHQPEDGAPVTTSYKDLFTRAGELKRRNVFTSQRCACCKQDAQVGQQLQVYTMLDAAHPALRWTNVVADDDDHCCKCHAVLGVDWMSCDRADGQCGKCSCLKCAGFASFEAATASGLWFCSGACRATC